MRALLANLDVCSVIVNGRPAPSVFIDETKINFEIPLETPAGAATIVVETNGVPSASFQFQAQADVQVPKSAAGTYPLAITVGGVESNPLAISVK